MSPMLLDAPVVKRNDITVRLDAEVAAKAKKVAALRGQNLAEYLTDIVAAVVDRDLQDEAAKMMRPPGPKRKPKGGG